MSALLRRFVAQTARVGGNVSLQGNPARLTCTQAQWMTTSAQPLHTEADTCNVTYLPSPKSRQIPAGLNAGGSLSNTGLEHLDGKINALLERHDDAREWAQDELRDAHASHAVLGWVQNSDAAHASALTVVRGEGVYIYDAEGRRYIDLNAGGMCVNLGHTVAQPVLDAVSKQLKSLTYTWPDNTVTPIRAKLTSLLGDVMPGDLNNFMFPSSGAEANEVIVRIARTVTGRQKIMTSYRSYHGGTGTTCTMTGDSRRWAAEAGTAGIVHFMPAYPYTYANNVCPHTGTVTDDEMATSERALTQLREQVMMEGAHTIAAIVLEGVTGTNGTQRHPKGYLEGVRALCDEHGILMVSDEVMAGWGRTGKLFGFQHSDGVIPDMVASAKGLNSALMPLGMVAMRSHVYDVLQTTAVGAGSTYNGHPVALASAYAVIKQFLKDDVLGKVRDIEPVIEEEMNRLAAAHPSVKQSRTVGCLGSLDIQRNTAGDFIAMPWEPMHPAMAAFRSRLILEGAWTLVKGHSVFVNPPLVITPDEVREAFGALDRALPVLDDLVEH